MDEDVIKKPKTKQNKNVDMIKLNERGQLQEFCKMKTK
jgi:hypothetical protein